MNKIKPMPKEMIKLINLLSVGDLFDFQVQHRKNPEGYQIIGKCWCVVWNTFSYGYEEGYLEIMSEQYLDDGIGWLTATEAYARICEICAKSNEDV